MHSVHNFFPLTFYYPVIHLLYIPQEHLVGSCESTRYLSGRINLDAWASKLGKDMNANLVPAYILQIIIPISIVHVAI